jgi:starch-binding outer membrane protein, SusD/RagB family
MKAAVLYCTLICLVLTFYSCSDDFLDKKPQGILFENLFYNETGIDALLIGTYALVGGSSFWEISWGASIQNWSFGSVASDDAYGGPFMDMDYVNMIERWSVTSTNSYVYSKWKWAQMGIHRANNVLNVIENTLELSPQQSATFKAEALFLRAYFNFEAMLVFGDYIPLISEDIKYPAEVSNVNSEGDVLNFIIKDLTFAAENLPEVQVQPGRPTKYAAIALAARVYLQEPDYEKAKPFLDNIISSSRYSLMPTFFDNFRIEKENNAESIFEIQANVNDIPESLNAEMGIGLNFPYGGDINMCCGFHQPSQNLANAFKTDESGLPLFNTFDDINLKNDQGIRSEEEFIPSDEFLDPRIDWTMGRRGIPYLDWGIMRGYDWIRDQNNGGPYLPAMKPFFYKAQRYGLSTNTGWMTGVNANNYRYIRYSHVLLWRAEVAAWEGDLQTAIKLVNMIRERAANEVVMGRVLIYRLPQSVYPWGEGSSDKDYLSGGAIDWSRPAANYKIGSYPSFAGREEALRAVQWEQRLEFATEGTRFFDLRRWDNLPEKIGGKSMADILNDYAENDLRIRTFMSGSNFSEKDKYRPVPWQVIRTQPGVIVQRPEYE